MKTWKYELSCIRFGFFFSTDVDYWLFGYMIYAWHWGIFLSVRKLALRGTTPACSMHVICVGLDQGWGRM